MIMFLSRVARSLAPPRDIARPFHVEKYHVQRVQEYWYARSLSGSTRLSNTNANGQHRTPSWRLSQSMSIRGSSNARTRKSQAQFIAESRLFSIVIEIPAKATIKE